ncbi:type I glyceraldehyde-3-phosphate dehydrogenase [Litoreibacter roseus]|uniref:Glyceraldehyde-3-phosphate dehydrogenase n=1 Tax=Litoreibacter roseus TaxID=2601869 RepID=A0A6N6JD03_9RHOB|nr:glyceraldehyde 3-phosphate dehydrogenase NAD-binding domain-containing protein [Litoreibacter roseus]GFE63984.1 glyceraldehyde-3-phosphate dehydrogenase [Litoreibacter roseus]
MARIAINGLGRIGRVILRLLTTSRQAEPLEVVALNDIASPEMCAYLLRHDSTFGPYPGEITYDASGLRLNGLRIPLTATPDLDTLDLSGVDLVLECTGKAKSRAFATAGLRAGAMRVLVSGPCPVADETIVMGANDDALADQQVVSNASCTTNALAPLARYLDDAFGIVTGHMTTIHCYTASQPTVDTPRGDLIRSRAAALSMVPTTTSAGSQVGLVLPSLADRITATSVRVPTASVSAIDLTVQTREVVNADQVNTALRAAPPNIFGWTDEPLVSSDLRARHESIIMALPETHVTSGGLLRVFGWYDNEWGFSNRMIDMALRMTA